MKRILTAGLAAVALVLTPAVAASAVPSGGTTVTYRGQGFIADGFGGYDLRDEICGVENGADADGPYLLWVFTSTKSTSATITGPWGTATMTKMGSGTFKYVSGWFDPDTLVGNVSATGDRSSTNPQLVVSHGCRPFEEGAWCSPGFWRNADAAAWALTGYSRTDPFNTTVPYYWFGHTYAADPTLDTVLATPQIYSGAPSAGTSGYALNAFNATGAMLTDQIPGFDYSWDVMIEGSDDACPIDQHGNFKD